jgi:threonine dehydratase
MVTLNAIREARERVASHVRPTPVLSADWLDELAGCPVFLKPENLQVTGSFKARGAASLMMALDQSAVAGGVIAASSGNHGLGVAYVGSRLGIPVTVVVPEKCSATKLDGLRQLGASVIFHGHSSLERRAHARELAETGHMLVVHSHDDPLVVAGQGTVGLEILNALPEVGTVLVPVGSGGLVSGIAVAIKESKPGVAVYGVEPEIGCRMKRSLDKGEIVELPETPDTVADGLRSTRTGDIPFAIVRRLLDGVLTVSENAIRDAVRRLHRHGKIVVEPSGAVVVAAIVEGKTPPSKGPVCAVLSGGNLDEALLTEILIDVTPNTNER